MVRRRRGGRRARHRRRAGRAAAAWGRTSITARTQVVFRFRELLNERKEELAAIITAEHGKVLSDALGEVSRGQEVVEFACGIPHLLKGGYSESVSTGVDVHSKRQPLGVVGIISPFNFPAMVPMWFFPIAIAAGNTVVLKPSEKDPSAAIWMAELWKEAGLPDGVFNVLQGDKEAVDALLDHPDVKAISFVGSTPDRAATSTSGRAATASASRPSAAPRTTWSCCPTPTSTWPPTRRSAPASARPASGAWRSASLVAVGPVADDLVAKIADRTRTLRIGDGTRGCRHGPAGHPGAPRTRWRRTSSRARPPAPRSSSTAARRRRRRGRRLLARPDAVRQRHPRRWRSTPTRSSARCSSWSGSETYDEAVELVNANPYGNGVAHLHQQRRRGAASSRTTSRSG